VLCQTGSLPFLAPAACDSAPVFQTAWLEAEPEAGAPPQAQVSTESSRAPPA
jgi:hypothetical protein